jgi:hypothetical protein
MAYEWRNGRLYLYKKVWKNGTCRSEYAGPAASPITQLDAQLDKLSRTRRELARMDAEDERDRWAKLASPPPLLLELEATARIAVAEALTAAGYHEHKRVWRKQRAKTTD